MTEKNVRIRLFKDNSRYKGDLFVSVNGVNYKIRRGVEVKVPPEVRRCWNTARCRTSAPLPALRQRRTRHSKQQDRSPAGRCPAGLF